MKKKLIALLLLICVVATAGYAGDFKFVFGDLDQHPEILIGFLPSYLNAGAGYTGLTLNEGDTTEIQFLAGAGYIQNKLWQSDKPNSQRDNKYILDDPLVYDVLRLDWTLRFRQGFGQSWVPDTDLVTAYVAYNGRYEHSYDTSLATGKAKKRWGADTSVLNTSAALAQLDNWESIYPFLKADGNGNRNLLGTTLSVGATLNMMEDRMVNQDGLSLKFQFDWAPLALNSALGGEADYYAASLNAVVGKTLYALYDGADHQFSITLVNRTNLSWIDGEKVPVYAQRPFSLGRKMRGFNSATYNRQFTAVNNLDIRFAGPEPVINGIFPRVNVFFDAGVAMGNTLNSTVGGKADFLASTGAQATVSVFDFIDLGFEVAYLISGRNYVNGPASRVATSVTFFLDF